MSARDEESRVRSSSGRDSSKTAPGTSRPGAPERNDAPNTVSADERPSARSAQDSVPGKLAQHALAWFYETPYSREAVVGGVLGLAFFVVTAKLFYLQAIETGEISTDASE